MKRLTQAHVIAAAVIVCLSAPEARAQSEKISLRMAPRPGQTVQMTVTQDMDFDMSMDGAPLPGGNSMKMVMRSTMALTQKTGPLKADGSVDAELTYDQIAIELSMNGQQMPASDVDTGLVGKPVVVTYNANGEVIGVKGLPAASGLTDETFKQMLGSFYGNLPVTALGVGETTTGPLDIPVPLPLPVPGAPMQMTGETILKLVSIDRDAQGRTARFDSTVNGRMDSAIPSPDGKGQLKFDITMIGDGTTIIDLNKGLPRSNIATSTFSGRMNMPAGAAPNATSMTMRGTVKVVMSSK